MDMKEYNKRYYKENKDKWHKRKHERTEYQKAHRDQFNLYQKDYYKKVGPKDIKAAKERGLSFVNIVKEHYGCSNPKCGWNGELKSCCLDFHHLDNENKKHVSQILNYSVKRLSEEINKCTLLCAICHRMATHNELDCAQFTRCNVSPEWVSQ